MTRPPSDAISSALEPTFLAGRIHDLNKALGFLEESIGRLESMSARLNGVSTSAPAPTESAGYLVSPGGDDRAMRAQMECLNVRLAHDVAWIERVAGELETFA